MNCQQQIRKNKARIYSYFPRMLPLPHTKLLFWLQKSLIKSLWGRHWTRSDCLNSTQWITGILNSPNYFLNSSIFLATAAGSISFITLFITSSVILTEKPPPQPFKMLHHISSLIFPQIKRSISIQSSQVWKLLKNLDNSFALHLPTLIYEFYRNILLQTFTALISTTQKKKIMGTSTSCSKIFMNKITAQVSVQTIMKLQWWFTAMKTGHALGFVSSLLTNNLLW